MKTWNITQEEIEQAERNYELRKEYENVKCQKYPDNIDDSWVDDINYIF